MWNEEYPVNLIGRFELLMSDATNYSHYIIENEAMDVIGWLVTFEKENELRFSLIVASAYQGKGIGKALIEHVKKEVNLLYGWVIDHEQDVKKDGSAYKSPVAFYKKLGFETIPDARLNTPMIQAVKMCYLTNK